MEIFELLGRFGVTGINEAVNQLNQVGSQMLALGNRVTSFGNSMVNNVTKPIMAGFGAAITTTMGFDASMSKVSATSGVTGKAFIELRNEALKMGRATTKTATESAEALNYMALAGWSNEEMLAGLEPILRASEAGAMDLATTSDLVTDSMSALGLKANDTGYYLDVAARAQNTSNQSLQQFLGAMVSAGGTFRMFNTPLEEAASLLGILANRGFKAHQAGNAITSLMANLTTGTGKAGDAMSALNIQVYDSDGKFKGMTNVLKEVNAKLATCTEEQRNTYIQMLGGKTRTKELTALLSGTKEELDGLTKKLYDSDGALSKMAATMQDNLNGKVTILKSSLEGIMIMIGDRLTPVLGKFADFVQSVAEKLFEMSDGTKDAIIVIGLIVAAIGPLIVILGSVVTGMGLFALALSVLTTPIGLIITSVTILTGLLGFGGLAGALLAIPAVDFNNIGDAFDSIRKKVSSLVNYLKKEWKPAIDYLIYGDKGALSKIDDGEFKNSLINLRESIKSMADKINEIVSKINNKFKSLDKNSVNDWSTNIVKGLDNIVKAAEFFIDVIDTIIGAWNKFKRLQYKAEIFMGDQIIADTAQVKNKARAEIDLLNMDLQDMLNKKDKLKKQLKLETTIEGKDKVKEKIRQVNLEIDNTQYDISSKTKKFEKKYQIDVQTGESVSKAKSKGQEVGFGFKLGVDNTNKNVAESFANLANNTNKLNKTKEANTHGSNTAANFGKGVSSQNGNVASNVNTIANNVKKLNKTKEANTLGSNLGSGYGKGISSKSGEVNVAAFSLTKAVSNPFTSIISIAGGWGKSIGNSIASGLRSAGGAISSAAGWVANKIASFFPSSPAKEGALRAIPLWMPTMVDMMSKGLIDNSDKLNDASGIVAAKITKNFDSIPSNLSISSNLNSISSNLNSIPSNLSGSNSVTNVYLSMSNTITKEVDGEVVINKMMKQIRSFGGAIYNNG